MVGGRVVEVIKLEKNRWWINCGGTRGEYRETCAIYLDPGEADIAPGDMLWWQGAYAMWTAYTRGVAGKKHDVRLKRIGYSGVSRPKKEDAHEMQ